MSFVAAMNAGDFQRTPRSSRPSTPRRRPPSHSQKQVPAFPKLPDGGAAPSATSSRSKGRGAPSGAGSQSAPAQRPAHAHQRPAHAHPAASQALLGDDGREAPEIQLGDRVHPSIQQRLKLPPLTSPSSPPALDLATEAEFDLKSTVQKPLPVPEKWNADSAVSSAQHASASSSETWRAGWKHKGPDSQDREALSRPPSASVLSEAFAAKLLPAAEPASAAPALTPDVRAKRWWSRAIPRVPEDSPKPEVDHGFRGASPEIQPRRCYRHIETIERA